MGLPRVVIRAVAGAVVAVGCNGGPADGPGAPPSPLQHQDPPPSPATHQDPPGGSQDPGSIEQSPSGSGTCPTCGTYRCSGIIQNQQVSQIVTLTAGDNGSCVSDNTALLCGGVVTDHKQPAGTWSSTVSGGFQIVSPIGTLTCIVTQQQPPPPPIPQGQPDAGVADAG